MARKVYKGSEDTEMSEWDMKNYQEYWRVFFPQLGLDESYMLPIGSNAARSVANYQSYLQEDWLDEELCSEIYTCLGWDMAFEFKGSVTVSMAATGCLSSTSRGARICSLGIGPGKWLALSHAAAHNINFHHSRELESFSCLGGKNPVFLAVQASVLCFLWHVFHKPGDLYPTTLVNISRLERLKNYLASRGLVVGG